MTSCIPQPSLNNQLYTTAYHCLVLLTTRCTPQPSLNNQPYTTAQSQQPPVHNCPISTTNCTPQPCLNNQLYTTAQSQQPAVHHNPVLLITSCTQQPNLNNQLYTKTSFDKQIPVDVPVTADSHPFDGQNGVSETYLSLSIDQYYSNDPQPMVLRC